MGKTHGTKITHHNRKKKNDYEAVEEGMRLIAIEDPEKLFGTLVTLKEQEIDED